jgi:hypothetical protein
VALSARKEKRRPPGNCDPSASHGLVTTTRKKGHFTWAISNEVLTEYEEMIRGRLGAPRWERFLRVLELGERTNGNLLRVHPQFRFAVLGHPRNDAS